MVSTRGQFIGEYSNKTSSLNISAELDETGGVRFAFEGANGRRFVSDRYALRGGPNSYTVDFRGSPGGFNSFRNRLRRSFPGVQVQAGDFAELTEYSEIFFYTKLRSREILFRREALPLAEATYISNDDETFVLSFKVTRTGRVRIDCMSDGGSSRLQRRFPLFPAEAEAELPDLRLIGDQEGSREFFENVKKTCKRPDLPTQQSLFFVFAATESRSISTTR
ncbi:hypothetical protein FOZ60_000007 [Perkinsus olseni]|uniref:Uncharacterized protein n=1 Tax=Perkinsus olseni TaxID=32597 RepID=A0A7J6PNK2_PEROL|nr:hypothetical protein FOZ60_000007 [Perkinsus olseni]